MRNISFFIFCLLLLGSATCSHLPVKPEPEIGFTPNLEIRVRQGFYRPDIDMIEEKFTATCRCLGKCHRNFVVSVVAEDSGAAGHTSFIASGAEIIYTAESLDFLSYQLVEAQLGPMAHVYWLLECGAKIDERINEKE